MANLSNYFVYCVTEGIDVLSDYVNTPPTTCPNNASHTIDSSKTRVNSEQLKQTLFSSGFMGSSASARYLQLAGASSPGSRNRICQFQYDGTNNTSAIVQVEAIVSNGANSGVTGILDLRPWNSGNTGSYGTGTIYLGAKANPTSSYITTFTNLPSTPTVLEFGITVIGTTSSMRIHALTVQQIFSE